MRVVQYNPFVDPEGRSPEALLGHWPALEDAARAGVLAGAEVTVVQPASAQAEVERVGARFVFVRERRRPRGPARLFEPYGSGALRVIAEAAPDVVHVQGLSYPFHTRAIARACRGVPLLGQDHSDRVRTGWRRAVQRWGLAPFAGVSFTSAEQATPFRQAGVLGRSVPVYEVVEGTTRFRPVPVAEAREATGLSGDPTVLWVGRLAPLKDPLTALAGVREAALRLPDLRFWMIYQDDELLADVRAWLAEHRGMADRVVLLGPVPHERVAEHLSAADVVLSASRRESCGYAVIEAHACGAAVVASDIPSHRTMLAGSSRAVVAPVGDAGAFASGIETLAGGAEPERADARRHFEAHMSLEAMGRQLGLAYRDVIERARHAGRA